MSKILKQINKTIFLAIIIRILIMPFFYHPDIKSQYFHFQFLQKGVLNIYSYLDKNKDNLPNTDTFNYLPLTYFTLGTNHLISQVFMPKDYSLWLNDWGVKKNDYSNLPIFLFILKIPYLFLDIGIAYLLYKLFPKKKLHLIWLFNPLTIYLIYILGNFDILPSFLTLLAFYFLNNKKNFHCYFSLGVAIAVKMYPILFLPFFLFYHKENLKQKFLNLLFLSLPLIISIAPFLTNTYFVNSFLGSGLTQKILEYKILNIPIYPIIYTIIFYLFIKSKNKEKSFYKSIFYLMIFFFALIKFHPQWLIWFLPFVIYPFSSINKIRTLFIFYILLFLVYTFLINDQFLFWGHLVPIHSNFLLLRTPFDLIYYKFHLNPHFLQNNIKYLMLFISFFQVYLYEKNN
jgi:hypothetical protein